MKVGALIFSALFGTAMAAPAIVWSNDGKSTDSVEYSSKSVKAKKLIANTVKDTPEDVPLSAAVFLVGRSVDGSESLSKMTASGSLPGIASKYGNASAVHSHVDGLASPWSVASDAGSITGRRVLEVSLGEFSSKLTSLGQEPEETEIEVDENGMITKAQKVAIKRNDALANADLVIVNVPASTEPKVIDETVVNTIEHKLVGNVVLAGIRSTEEVKRERNMEARRKIKMMEQAGKEMSRNGRRLDENNGDDDDASSSDDMSGVFYVVMTPNIFAGLLFGLMFIVVTWIGVQCMGMISGQDVYVSKMPTIGREA